MNNVKKYYEVINERLGMILDQEMEHIEQAAEVISEKYCQTNWFRFE